MKPSDTIISVNEPAAIPQNEPRSLLLSRLFSRVLKYRCNEVSNLLPVLIKRNCKETPLLSEERQKALKRMLDTEMVAYIETISSKMSETLIRNVNLKDKFDLLDEHFPISWFDIERPLNNGIYKKLIEKMLETRKKASLDAIKAKLDFLKDMKTKLRKQNKQMTNQINLNKKRKK